MNVNVKAALGGSKLNGFHIMLMVLCMVVVLTEGYDLVIYSSIKHQLMVEWGMDTVMAGVIGSAALAGMMIGAFTLGFLADLFGRKRVLILCVVFFSVFTGLAGFMHNPASFAACRFVAGLGIGGVAPNAMGLLSDYAPQKSKNTLIATAMAGMQVGGIIAPIVTLAAGPEGWRICMWVAFVPLVAVPFLIKLMPDSIDHTIKAGKFDALKKTLVKAVPGYELDVVATAAGAAAAAKKEKSPVSELFTNHKARSTVMFWIAFFMGLLMIYGLNTWLPELMQAAGYELGSSLTFLISLNLSALVGSVILGRLADRFDTRKVLIILYIVGGISMLLLSIKSTMVIAYILTAICGICTFGPQNVGTAYVADYYPSRIRSTGLGVCNTVGRLGGILGPTLGGVLMSASLPMIMNCLAFAIPGFAASAAYMLVQQKYASKEAEHAPADPPGGDAAETAS